MAQYNLFFRTTPPTLCLAYRDISEAKYCQWSVIYNQAAATINGCGDTLDKVAELIEKDMFLLGATAVEDKLQDGVPIPYIPYRWLASRFEQHSHKKLAYDSFLFVCRFGF